MFRKFHKILSRVILYDRNFIRNEKNVRQIIEPKLQETLEMVPEACIMKSYIVSFVLALRKLLVALKNK